MRTSEVIKSLSEEGFEVTPGYLDFLFRERYLPKPSKSGPCLDWEPVDVDRLRSVLRRRGRGPDKGLWVPGAFRLGAERLCERASPGAISNTTGMEPQ